MEFAVHTFAGGHLSHSLQVEIVEDDKSWIDVSKALAPSLDVDPALIHASSSSAHLPNPISDKPSALHANSLANIIHHMYNEETHHLAAERIAAASRSSRYNGRVDDIEADLLRPTPISFHECFRELFFHSQDLRKAIVGVEHNFALAMLEIQSLRDAELKELEASQRKELDALVEAESMAVPPGPAAPVAAPAAPPPPSQLLLPGAPLSTTPIRRSFTSRYQINSLIQEHVALIQKLEESWSRRIEATRDVQTQQYTSFIQDLWKNEILYASSSKYSSKEKSFAASPIRPVLRSRSSILQSLLYYMYVDPSLFIKPKVPDAVKQPKEEPELCSFKKEEVSHTPQKQQKPAFSALQSRLRSNSNGSSSNSMGIPHSQSTSSLSSLSAASVPSASPSFSAKKSFLELLNNLNPMSPTKPDEQFASASSISSLDSSATANGMIPRRSFLVEHKGNRSVVTVTTAKYIDSLCRYKQSGNGSIEARTSMLEDLYNERTRAMVLVCPSPPEAKSDLSRYLNTCSTSHIEWLRCCRASTEFHFEDVDSQWTQIAEELKRSAEAEKEIHEDDEEDDEEDEAHGEKGYVAENGDVFVTRHSNLSSVHTVMHLVASASSQIMSNKSSGGEEELRTHFERLLLMAQEMNCMSLAIKMPLSDPGRDSSDISFACLTQMEQLLKSLRSYLEKGNNPMELCIFTPNQDVFLQQAEFSVAKIFNASSPSSQNGASSPPPPPKEIYV